MAYKGAKDVLEAILVAPYRATAIEEWRAALAAYEGLGHGEGIARTVYDAAWELAWLGQMRAAQDLARCGLHSLGDRHEATRCRLLAVLSTFTAGAGDDYQLSYDLITEAEGLAGDTGAAEADRRVTPRHVEMAEAMLKNV